VPYCKKCAVCKTADLTDEGGRVTGKEETHIQAPTGKDVWSVGRNVRGMAALGSTHPYNGS